MSNKKVLVVGGGFGSERDISIKTSGNFYRIAKKIFKSVKLMIIDRVDELIRTLKGFKPSCVINGLHGKFGEDGRLQAILDSLEIPYTGSNAFTSALCMDKFKSLMLAKSLGFSIPETCLFELSKPAKTKFPLVVKPNREGSSVGVSIVTSKIGLENALKIASQFDSEVLYQEYLRGKEVTVAVVNSRCLEPIEIRPKGTFYDYEHKYTPGLTEFLLPSSLNSAEKKVLKNISFKLYKFFKIRQYCRIDFIWTTEPFLIEVNTLPGFTETSLVPKALQYEGIDIEEFVKEIVETARFDPVR
ncbi:MAG: D-alanine--D-alanine ligase [Deltaproteobacteria bacterium]|nr:D-alanine--D-alanine ligase [Deltaproteobacteria bacterium]MCX7952732.1 D-alanine--D-alanine ligase [Deltaproteobacteria bacterium]